MLLSPFLVTSNSFRRDNLASGGSLQNSNAMELLFVAEPKFETCELINKMHTHMSGLPASSPRNTPLEQLSRAMQVPWHTCQGPCYTVTPGVTLGATPLMGVAGDANWHGGSAELLAS